MRKAIRTKQSDSRRSTPNPKPEPDDIGGSLDASIARWSKITNADLKDAAAKLAKAGPIPGYHSLPDAHSKEPFVPESERLKRPQHQR